MCVCDFWGSINHEILADLLSAGLGESVTAPELALAGERIWNLGRLFNLRAGFTAADDSLPHKIMNQPLEKGTQSGKVFAKADFEKAKSLYYQLRDWDENGSPTKNKLVELKLDHIAI